MTDHPPDRDLRQRLSDRAAGIDPHPDWDDLSRRVAHRHRKRTRALAGLAGLALVGGSAAGFALGRVGTERPREVATGPVPAGPGTSIGTTPVPVVPRASGTPVEGASVDGDEADASRVTLDGGWSVGGMPLGRVFVRTTADDVVIRGYAAEYEPYDDGNPFWTPPGWCYATGVVQADVSTDAVAGVVMRATFEATPDGQLAAALGVIGVDEGAPVWVVVVQAPPGADTVRASFPGGGFDSMTPEGGIAALAAPAAGQPETEQTVTVEAVAGGDVVASREATLYDGGFLGEQGDSGECIPPPPALPAAGEQPADVEAARAAVTQAFEDAYNGSAPEEVRAAAIDDPDLSLAPIREQLRSGSYADQVASGHAVVRDLVFTAPDHAWVLYDVLTGDTPAVTNRFGEAVLVDGIWKVTEATLCQDIALAGITC